MAPIGDIFSELRGVLADIAPILKDLIRSGMQVLAKVFLQLKIWVVSFVNAMRELGILSGTKKELKETAQGAAARPVTQMDLEAFGNAILKAGLETGMPEKEDQVPLLLIDQKEYLKQIKEWTDWFKAWILATKEVGSELTNTAATGLFALGAGPLAAYNSWFGHSGQPAPAQGK